MTTDQPQSEMTFYERSIREKKCPLCGRDINPREEFRSKFGRQEYELTGVCQRCQDEDFSEDDPTPDGGEP